MYIRKVDISEKHKRYLAKRGLSNQFEKQIDYLLKGHFSVTDFKLRAPKSHGIYSFRINKQFRAWCTIEGESIFVFRIDNHSDKRKR